MHSLTLYGTPEHRLMIEGEFQEEMDAYDLEEGRPCNHRWHPPLFLPNLPSRVAKHPTT
jgi:hypothetical protein